MRIKLTEEQKKANKETRKRERVERKIIEEIEAQKNQKKVKALSISIEWKKSRTWGYNPHLEADIYFQDGTSDVFRSTASGCGYDKESQVISDLFNYCLKYKVYEREELVKDFPYGVRLSEFGAYYSGGIGTDCYYKIAEFIGGKFEKVASGKTYDAYKYVDL